MDESLHKAFLVLIVGMLTVFVILTLVVCTGWILILLVNKFAPLPIEQKKQSKNIVSSKKPYISKSKLAIIVAAVEAVAGPNANITDIEKIDY